MANHRDGDAEPIRREGGLTAKRAAGKAGHIRLDQSGQVIDKRSPAHGGSSSSGARIFRCAVYTGKSSEEGLEQDFNSLHAQREACEAYIASQRHERWTVPPTATMMVVILAEQWNGRASTGCSPISPQG